MLYKKELMSQNNYIIWMDADFQHPPKYIKNFIEISDRYDVVISSRFLKKSESILTLIN